MQGVNGGDGKQPLWFWNPNQWSNSLQTLDLFGKIGLLVLWSDLEGGDNYSLIEHHHLHRMMHSSIKRGLGFSICDGDEMKGEYAKEAWLRLWIGMRVDRRKKVRSYNLISLMGDNEREILGMNSYKMNLRGVKRNWTRLKSIDQIEAHFSIRLC